MKLELYENDGATFRPDKHRGDFVINPSERNILTAQSIGVANVEVNFSLGSYRQNFTFLSQYPFIRGISVIGSDNIDPTFLYPLAKLEMLLLGSQVTSRLDLSLLPHLNYCHIIHSKKVINIGSLRSLRQLILTGYHAANLEELRALDQLIRLSLINSSINSLNGIQGLSQLETLDLYGLRKLLDLTGLGSLEKLSVLDFEKCSVNDLSEIANLAKLRSFGLHDCKAIPTLKPIAKLTALDVIYISGNTNILDGDMTPLMGRMDASVATRKHYSHTHDQIDKLNSTIRPKQTWDY